MANIVKHALTISCCKCPVTVMISAKVLDNGATIELMLPEEWSPLERTNLRGCINVSFKCPDCVDVKEEPCSG